MSRLTRDDLLHLREGIELLLVEFGGTASTSADGVDAMTRQKLRSEMTRNTSRLPAASRLRKLIRDRGVRVKFFDDALFFDPCWEMMLQLLLVEIEGEQISVSSLCYASGSAQTTALRHLNVLIDSGLVSRTEDPGDKRRTFVTLTEHAIEAMSRYFALIDRPN